MKGQGRLGDGCCYFITEVVGNPRQDQDSTVLNVVHSHMMGKAIA